MSSATTQRLDFNHKWAFIQELVDIQTVTDTIARKSCLMVEHIYKYNNTPVPDLSTGIPKDVVDQLQDIKLPKYMNEKTLIFCIAVSPFAWSTYTAEDLSSKKAKGVAKVLKRIITVRFNQRNNISSITDTFKKVVDGDEQVDGNEQVDGDSEVIGEEMIVDGQWNGDVDGDSEVIGEMIVNGQGNDDEESEEEMETIRLPDEQEDQIQVQDRDATRSRPSQQAVTVQKQPETVASRESGPSLPGRLAGPSATSAGQRLSPATSIGGSSPPKFHFRDAMILALEYQAKKRRDQS